jgi:hypothetical protein
MFAVARRSPPPRPSPIKGEGEMAVWAGAKKPSPLMGEGWVGGRSR